MSITVPQGEVLWLWLSLHDLCFLFGSLAAHEVHKDAAGDAHVEALHLARHGYRHRLTRGQRHITQPAPLAPQNQAQPLILIMRVTTATTTTTTTTTTCLISDPASGGGCVHRVLGTAVTCSPCH